MASASSASTSAPKRKVTVAPAPAVGGAGAPVTTDVESFWLAVDGKGKKKPPTQLERYIAKESPAHIIRFIAMGGGPRMGTTLEEFARFRFKNLAKRHAGKEETGYDHVTKAPADVYIEQKSSGYWKNKGDDFKWQHVEVDHKWNMLLLCGIGYTDCHFWGMNRATFLRLIDEKKITNQGNKAGDSSEGMWFWYSAVKEALTPIRTDAELLAFASAL